MRRFYLILVFIIVTIIPLTIIYADTGEKNRCGLFNTPVSTKHPVYDFLDRLETRGLIEFKDNIKPLTRFEIVECLDNAALRVSGHLNDCYLSSREKNDLLRFLNELSQSDDVEFRTNISKTRQNLWPKSPTYRDGNNFYSYYAESIDIQANPLLYWDVLSDSTGETILRRVSGINLIAGIGSNTAIYFDFRDTQESGRGPYNYGERYKLYEDNAGFVTMDGNDVAYYDITRAVMSMKYGNLMMHFGRGDNQWGAGKVENFLISDNPPPFDYLAARYDLADFMRFSYMTGFLHPYPEVYASIDTTASGKLRKRVAGKYISAHRLEVYPFHGVEIGLSESVVYGERGLEIAYLNPVNLYFSAEHNLGDMDNVAWSGDIQLNLIKGVSLYAELFIDDMRTSELGTDYVGNKFAYNTGIFIVDPLGIRNTDLISEYARLDPFVYTHFYPVNVYKNWNSSLGYSLPPNSDRWYFELNWKPFYTLSGGISASFTRHGANTDEINAGGNIDTPLDPEQQSSQFLSGEKIYNTLIGVSLNWEPMEHYFIRGRYRHHEWTGGDQSEWSVSFGLNLW